LKSWFIFSYDDVVSLFQDPRLSADRMKGLVDAAPVEVRDELRKIAPYLEMWMLMKDGEDHARIRTFMNLGFNAHVVHGLRTPIQQATDELLDRVQDQKHMDGCQDFAFLLPAYVLSDLLGVDKEDRGKVVQWSLDFVDFFNVVPISVDTSQRLTRSGFAMITYTKDLLEEHRAHPRDDFLGTLVNTMTEKGGFTDDEIFSNAIAVSIISPSRRADVFSEVGFFGQLHPSRSIKRTAASIMFPHWTPPMPRTAACHPATGAPRVPITPPGA
jgi:cytochrome P450